MSASCERLPNGCVALAGKARVITTPGDQLRVDSCCDLRDNRGGLAAGDEHVTAAVTVLLAQPLKRIE
jgi:hypothetical protein